MDATAAAAPPTHPTQPTQPAQLAVPPMAYGQQQQQWNAPVPTPSPQYTQPAYGQSAAFGQPQPPYGQQMGGCPPMGSYGGAMAYAQPAQMPYGAPPPPTAPGTQSAPDDEFDDFASASFAPMQAPTAGPSPPVAGAFAAGMAASPPAATADGAAAAVTAAPVPIGVSTGGALSLDDFGGFGGMGDTSMPIQRILPDSAFDASKATSPANAESAAPPDPNAVMAAALPTQLGAPAAPAGSGGALGGASVAGGASGGGGGGEEDLSEIPKGSEVWYSGADGQRMKAVVMKVHYDDPPPYYTIAINGQERSTVRTKLTPCTAESDAQPGAMLGVPDASARAPPPPDLSGLGGMPFMTAAAPCVGGGDDGFGDFGGFDDAAAPPSSVPAVSAALPPSGGMLSADMFGAAASTTEVAAPPAAAAAAGGDDGFGDFGGFDDAPPPTSTLASGSVPGALASSGGVASADIVDSTSLASGPLLTGSSADAFGGFGDFDRPLSAPQTTMPASLLAVAADEDDNFGSFSAITPSVVASTSAPPSASADSSEGGLQAVVAALISQERFSEAASCKAHIEAIANVSVQLQAYERAKADDDLETAIHLKKVVLPRLREAVQPEAVLAQWQAPLPSHLTLAQMQSAAEAHLGAAEAAPFTSHCCARDPGAMAASSLELAARWHAAAAASLQLLLELGPAAQSAQLQRLDALLEALVSKLRLAHDALAARSADVPREAMRSAQVTALLSSLCELRRHGTRLAASRAWYAAVFVASATAGRPPPDAAAAATCKGITELVRAAHAAVGRGGEEEEGEAEAKEDREALRVEGSSCYWAAPLPMTSRCALSLLPLRSAAFPELPATIEWDGASFHAPLASLWAHGVRDEPPGRS